MVGVALDYRQLVNDPADLENNSQISLSVSSTGAQTSALPEGIYDVWCDVNVYLKVGTTASDVTTSTGYFLIAGNVVPLLIRDQRKLGGILASGTGTLNAHRVR